MKFKALPSYSDKDLTVNRETGKISGVRIANFGRNKNGSFFHDKFLNDLVKNGNDQTRGVKSRFGHPNECASSTSLGTYIGRYENFYKEGKNVFADLAIDNITKKTNVEGRGITMFEYIFDMAENNPDALGNSIVIDADSYEGEFEDDEGETTIETFYKLNSLKFSDLVGEPAATDELFANSKDLGVKLTNFLDENAQIFELIDKKPELITDFFERYESYLTKNHKSSNMSLFNKLKKQFSKTYDVDKTLLDGTIVTIVTEDETPKEGDPVQDQDGNAVPNDDHKTQDGQTITTVDGAITNIQETDNGEGGEGENEVQQQIDANKSNLEKFQKDVEDSLILMSNQMEKMNKTMETMAKGTTSKYEAPKRESSKSVNKKDSFADKVQERKEELRERKSKNQ